MADYDTMTRDELAHEYHKRGGNPRSIRVERLRELLRDFDSASEPSQIDALIRNNGGYHEDADPYVQEPAGPAPGFAQASPPVQRSESVSVLLARASAEVGKVAKAGKNTQYSYEYRTYDDVVAAVRGPLARHGVAMVFDITDRTVSTHETRSGATTFHVVLTVRYRFIGPVDDLTVTMVGEGMDNLDKATNKALVAATKYMLTTVFLIGSGDEPDAGHGQEEVVARQPQREPAAGFATLDEEGPANVAARERLKALPREHAERVFAYVKDQGFTMRDPWPRALCERVEELAELERPQTVDEPVDDTPAPVTDEEQRRLEELGEEPF